MKFSKIILGLVAALLFVSTAVAQDSLNAELLYQYRGWSSVMHLTAVDSLVYVGAGFGGLRIADISNPANPMEIGYCLLPGGYAGWLAVSGSYAYIGGGDSGFSIADVSDPQNPMPMGHCDAPDGVHQVAVSGSLAFLACASAGLQIVDVSDPLSPVIVGYVGTTSLIEGCAAAGNYAYTVSYNGVLQVIDVSDPHAPAPVGSCSLLGIGRALTIVGSLAYVANGSAGGLVIVDISNPTNPSVIGHCDTPGEALDVVVQGQYAYVADNNAGMRVINVANPWAPVQTGYYNPGGYQYTYGVAVSGSHVFTGNEYSGMRIINVANPVAPYLVTIMNLAMYADDMTVFGEGQYLARTNSGLDILDISDPSDPEEISHLDITYPGGVAVSGLHLFVGGTDSLRVADVSNPGNPVWVGSTTIAGSVYGIAISGDYAYLAVGYNGMVAVNITNPANPVVVGSYDNENGIVLDVAVVGNYAYLADEEHCFIILDVANPAHPVPVGHWGGFPWGATGGIGVSGSYVYLPHELYELAIIDVSDPTAPTLAGYNNMYGSVADVFVSGLQILVTTDSYGLRRFDISNPPMLLETGYYGYNSYGQIAAWNSTVYTIGSSYFTVLQLSDPQLMITLAPINPPIVIPATGGSFQFNADVINPGTGSAPCQLWTMQQTPSGTWLGPLMGPILTAIPAAFTASRIRTQNVPGAAEPGVYIYRGYVGVYGGAIWDSSSFTYTKSSIGEGPIIEDWLCWEDSTPTENSDLKDICASCFILHPCSPNPFNPTTTISYQLPADGHVSLKVFDVSGRLVATLADGWRRAGVHEVNFDGSDLTAGIYIYRITAGNWSTSEKMILLK